MPHQRFQRFGCFLALFLFDIKSTQVRLHYESDFTMLQENLSK